MAIPPIMLVDIGSERPRPHDGRCVHCGSTGYAGQQCRNERCPGRRPFAATVHEPTLAEAMKAERKRVLAEVRAAILSIDTFAADDNGEQVGAVYFRQVEEALDAVERKLGSGT